MKTISSQRYLDTAIVAAKSDAGDYEVTVVPVTLEGVSYLVVTDGHHSLAAAKRDGKAPEIAIDRTSEIARFAAAEPEAWMAQHQLDSEWYDVATGLDLW